jgi:hypothetical protein
MLRVLRRTIEPSPASIDADASTQRLGHRRQFRCRQSSCAISDQLCVHHRLSRSGDRQLNFCLHVMAMTQIRQNTRGRAYYLRKRSQGKSRKEALRCVKRRLSDAVYRQLLNDATRMAVSPGGHSSSDRPLPEPTGGQTTTARTRPLDTERRRCSDSPCRVLIV